MINLTRLSRAISALCLSACLALPLITHAGIFTSHVSTPGWLQYEATITLSKTATTATIQQNKPVDCSKIDASVVPTGSSGNASCMLFRQCIAANALGSSTTQTDPAKLAKLAGHALYAYEQSCSNIISMPADASIIQNQAAVTDYTPAGASSTDPLSDPFSFGN